MVFEIVFSLAFGLATFGLHWPFILFWGVWGDLEFVSNTFVLGLALVGLAFVLCIAYVLLCYGCSNQIKIGNMVTVTGEEGLLLFFVFA